MLRRLRRLVLLNFDLAGAEWTVVAYLSRDENMLSVVRSGRSPHVVTANLATGVDEATIKLEDKAVGLMRDPERIAAIRREQFPQLFSARFLPRTLSLRQCFKKANHGGNYREGYKMFALMNEMEEREAKRIIDLYSGVAYPGLHKWWDLTDAQIRKTRTLANCFGRKCYFMGQIGNDTFKQAYAFVPQSTVVDSCNQAMARMFEDSSADFAPAQLLAQVHDSLLTQYLSTDFAAIARFCIKLGLDYMRPVLDYGEPFRLNVDLKVGFDWAHLVEIKLTEDADDLAAKLQSLHASRASVLDSRAA